jgi:hypothetical protein
LPDGVAVVGLALAELAARVSTTLLAACAARAPASRSTNSRTVPETKQISMLSPFSATTNPAPGKLAHLGLGELADGKRLAASCSW